MKDALISPQEFKANPYLDPDWEESTGLGYLGAVAQEMGHEVKLFVPTTETLSELCREVIAWKPDVVGLQLYTCQVPDGLAMTKRIRKALPSALIVAGGPHPSALPNVISESAIDLAVIGEGEETWREILRVCEAGSRDFSQIQGLAYKDRGGRVTRTESRPRIDDLGKLPSSPMRIDPRQFRYQPGDPCSLYYPEPSRVICISDVAGRGCTHNCRFCSSPKLWERCYKVRSCGDVAEESFVGPKEKWGVNLVFMEDLTFSLAPKWVELFCKQLLVRKINMNWWCQTTVRSVTPELLALMRKAGCRTVAWGIEATDEASQKWMGEKQSLEETRLVLDAAAKLGIINWGYVVFAWPTQTLDAVWRNAMELRKLNLHRIRLSIATPLPGSEWFDDFHAGELSTDWRLFDTDHLVFDHPHIGPTEIREVRAEIFSQFYSSKAYRGRVEQFVARFPELEQSFTEFFAYTMKFV